MLKISQIEGTMQKVKMHDEVLQKSKETWGLLEILNRAERFGGSLWYDGVFNEDRRRGSKEEDLLIAGQLEIVHRAKSKKKKKTRRTNGRSLRAFK